MSITKYQVEVVQSMPNSQQITTPGLETRQVESHPAPLVRQESGQIRGSDMKTSKLNNANSTRNQRATSLPEGSILAEILASAGSAPTEHRDVLYSFDAQYADEQMGGATDSSAVLELSKLLKQAENAPPTFQGTFYKFAAQFAAGQMKK